MKYKGSTFLKVMGILCIIFGAIGLAGSAVTKGSLALLAAYGVETSTFSAAITLALVGAIIMLVAGIVGVANSKKPEKAMVPVIFGVLLVVIEVVNIILTFKMAGVVEDFASSMGVSTSMGSTKATSFISLIIPILYLIAALQLKSNKTTAQPGGFEA